MECAPLFLFGMQRSGTNFAFSVLSSAQPTKTFNESSEAFTNFALREYAHIQQLIEAHPKHVCLFKSISDLFKMMMIKEYFADAKFVVLYRRPKEVIDSYAYEFGADMNIINHVINFDLFYDDLETATGAKYRIPRIRELLDLLVGRFIPSSDLGNKIALVWLLTHLFILDSGVLELRDTLLVSYDELICDPTSFTSLIQNTLMLDLTFPQSLPAVRNRRLFFSETVSTDILERCDNLYKELETVRVFRRRHTYVSGDGDFR